MKASVVYRSLKAIVIKGRLPVFIRGTPGIGKSSVVHQLAAELGIALKDIRALLLDPVDLRGLPFVGKTADRHGRHRIFSPRTSKASCS